ncbi:XRE family transcriptional regulator [Spirillospora sp. NPDC049024]
MSNERLKDAMLSKGLSPEQLAEELGVDPKTVERWITTGRKPYPKYRHRIAALLREGEQYLWPDALTETQAARVNESEIVKVYPHRSMVPAELWDRLLDKAKDNIDILVYVGMFLTEKHDLLAKLQAKASSGARVRLLFGDPSSETIIQRSIDEGIGKHAIPAKIGHALAFFQPLRNTDGIELRQHATVLYNSIYRFDNELIANPHVYGVTAPHAPALHLRRLSAGDMFSTYTTSFDAVWNKSVPVPWSDAED